MWVFLLVVFFIGVICHQLIASRANKVQASTTLLLFFLTAPAEVILFTYVASILVNALLPDKVDFQAVTLGNGPSSTVKKTIGSELESATARFERLAVQAEQQSRLGLHRVPAAPSTSTASSFSPTTPARVPTSIVDSTTAASNSMGTFKAPKDSAVPGMHVVSTPSIGSERTLVYLGHRGSFTVTNPTVEDAAAAASAASGKDTLSKLSDYAGIGSFIVGGGVFVTGVLYNTGGNNVVVANPPPESKSDGSSSSGSAPSVTAQHPSGGQSATSKGSPCELFDDFLSNIFDVAPRTMLFFWHDYPDTLFHYPRGLLHLPDPASL
jgi:hypothetical protein